MPNEGRVWGLREMEQHGTSRMSLNDAVATEAHYGEYLRTKAVPGERAMITKFIEMARERRRDLVKKGRGPSPVVQVLNTAWKELTYQPLNSSEQKIKEVIKESWKESVKEIGTPAVAVDALVDALGDVYAAGERVGRAVGLQGTGEQLKIAEQHEYTYKGVKTILEHPSLRKLTWEILKRFIQYKLKHLTEDQVTYIAARIWFGFTTKAGPLAIYGLYGKAADKAQKRTHDFLAQYPEVAEAGKDPNVKFVLNFLLYLADEYVERLEDLEKEKEEEMRREQGALPPTYRRVSTLGVASRGVPGVATGTYWNWVTGWVSVPGQVQTIPTGLIHGSRTALPGPETQSGLS